MDELVMWLREVLDERERCSSQYGDRDMVLADVEAKRSLLALWGADEVASIGLAYDPSWQVLAHVLRVIAYGHRFDIPEGLLDFQSYDPAWTPEDLP